MRISISQLNRPVVVCSAKDVVENGSLHFARQGIRTVWASLNPFNSSSFGQQGQNSEQRPTHRAVIRAMADMELTSAAWLYEQRAISADIWYRIVGQRDHGEWWQLDLMLYERGDDAGPLNSSGDLGLSRKPGITL